MILYLLLLLAPIPWDRPLPEPVHGAWTNQEVWLWRKADMGEGTFSRLKGGDLVICGRVYTSRSEAMRDLVQAH